MRILGRSLRGALFLSHWLLVVPAALLRIALWPPTTDFARTAQPLDGGPMSPPRASLVVIGQVVIAAEADRLLTAEAIGIADGRVVSAGTRDEVLEAAHAGATLVEVGIAAVVPGLRDFHLHLVGMARARREVAAGRCRRPRAELVEPAARRRRAAPAERMAARPRLA